MAEINFKFTAIQAWMVALLSIAICMFAGFGAAWLYMLHTTPRYQQELVDSIDDKKGKNKAMNAWNKKVIGK